MGLNVKWQSPEEVQIAAPGHFIVQSLNTDLIIYLHQIYVM